MKKVGKKALSLLVALVLAVSCLFGTTAFATDGKSGEESQYYDSDVRTMRVILDMQITVDGIQKTVGEANREGYQSEDIRTWPGLVSWEKMSDGKLHIIRVAIDFFGSHEVKKLDLSELNELKSFEMRRGRKTNAIEEIKLNNGKGNVLTVVNSDPTKGYPWQFEFYKGFNGDGVESAGWNVYVQGVGLNFSNNHVGIKYEDTLTETLTYRRPNPRSDDLAALESLMSSIGLLGEAQWGTYVNWHQYYSDQDAYVNELYLEECNLTGNLDVSAFKNLYQLKCQDNELTGITFAEDQTALKYIYAQNNQLEAMPVLPPQFSVGDTQGTNYDFANNLMATQNMTLNGHQLTVKTESENLQQGNIVINCGSKFDGRDSQNNALYKKVFTLMATPAEGYMFDHWKVSTGGTIPATQGVWEGIYELDDTKITQDISYTACFKKEGTSQVKGTEKMSISTAVVAIPAKVTVAIGDRSKVSTASNLVNYTLAPLADSAKQSLAAELKSNIQKLDQALQDAGQVIVKKEVATTDLSNVSVTGAAAACDISKEAVTLQVDETSATSSGISKAKYAMDIKMEQKGQEVQPNTPVYFSMDLPQGADLSKLELWHIKADGSKEKVAFTANGQNASFAATSFSEYVFAEKDTTPTPTPTPPPSYPVGGGSIGNTDESTDTADKPQGNFVSDTVNDMTVNSAYQFKITSKDGTAPNFTVGTAGVFDVIFTQVNGEYFFKLVAIGKPGDKAGIYLNGEKLLVATVGETASVVPGVKSDTSGKFNVPAGKTYQFKLTADKKPSMVAGSAGFKVVYAGQNGKDYFYKVTVTGKKGDGTGIYVNGSKTPVAVISVA